MVRFSTTPLPSVRHLGQEMDRLFNSLFGDSVGSISAKLAAPVFPTINLWEESGRYVAEAELPGVRHEDLDITVLGREVTLRGERKRPEPAEGESGPQWLAQERPHGRFERKLRLPLEVDANRVEAQLVDGVLTLSLPKAESVLPRQIKVNAEG